MKYSYQQWHKGYVTMQSGEKVPRKLKKALVGKKVSKQKIRKMILDARIIKQKYPEPALILPFPFCPYCGCDNSFIVNHGVHYPEIWETEYCLRCHEKVGGADNSPFHHILEDIVLEKSVRSWFNENHNY